MSGERLARQLPGRRAFITGGGSGLGFALATQLAAAGFTLGILDREPGRLAEARDALGASGAAAVHTYIADVTDEAAFGSAVQAFVAATGGLELMVNNAGVAVAGSVAATPLADWRWALEINLLGVLTGCRLALPAMTRGTGGLVINIASAAGFASGPGMAAYNASKAAVVSLTETLAAEHVGTNLRFLVAMPGFFPTRLLDTMRAPPDALGAAKKLMQHSRYTAERAAQDILAAAADARLYVVLPSSYRTLWRIKRFLPMYFLRLLVRRAGTQRGRGGGSTART